MKTTDFTTTILVDQTPKEAFEAINNPRGWWSEEIKGNTEKPNDVFDYHFEDIHRSKIKIIESIPDKKVVWHVLEHYFKPGIFTDDPQNGNLDPGEMDDDAEWKDTKMVFEILEKDGRTQIRFTHHGLVPEFECFEVCSNSWGHYIQKSLFDLITTGKGHPNRTGAPMTTDEQRFRAAQN